MQYNYCYTQKSNWLLSDIGLTNRIKIQGIEYARLNMPGEFDYPSDKIKLLTDAYDPREEKGGLIFFKPYLQNGNMKFVMVDVAIVKNVSEEKEVSYKPDGKELDEAFKKALNNKYLPCNFHTHPTIESNENIVMQGLNFLNQLNTSIQDQGVTRWCFRYNGVDVRLPQLLVLENVNAVFIGMYGGLVAPLCFTEQKNKVLKASMNKTFEKIGDWANTPGKQTAVVLSVVGLFVSAVAFPKVVLPTAFAAGTIVPPMMYANHYKHEFFGVTYTNKLKIQIPLLSDYDIVNYELKAITAQEEAKRKKSS